MNPVVTFGNEDLDATHFPNKGHVSWVPGDVTIAFVERLFDHLHVLPILQRLPSLFLASPDGKVNVGSWQLWLDDMRCIRRRRNSQIKFLGVAWGFGVRGRSGTGGGSRGA